MDYALKLKDFAEQPDRHITIPFSPFSSWKWTSPVTEKKIVLVPSDLADPQNFNGLVKEYLTHTAVVLPECKPIDDTKVFVGWTSVFSSDLYSSDPVIPDGVPFSPKCAYTELKPCFTDTTNPWVAHIVRTYASAEISTAPNPDANAATQVVVDFTESLVAAGYDPAACSRIVMCRGWLRVAISALIPPRIYYTWGEIVTPSNQRGPYVMRGNLSLHTPSTDSTVLVGECSAKGDSIAHTGTESTTPASRVATIVRDETDFPAFDLDLTGGRAVVTLVFQPTAGGGHVTGINAKFRITDVAVYT